MKFKKALGGVGILALVSSLFVVIYCSTPADIQKIQDLFS